MIERSEAVRLVHAALEREPGVNLHRNPIDIEFAEGLVTLTGDLDSIAAKRLAVQRASRLPFAAEVEDRLRVRPAEPRDDGAIKDGLALGFDQERIFHGCNIHLSWHGQEQTVGRLQGEEACTIDARISDGVVILRGEVWSLSHRRLAEAICWWTPGVRDVIDELIVVPAEEDTDDEINDAVVMVLAKDPLVQGGQVAVTTRERVVTLRGVVRNPYERKMAEDDCWFLSGVAGVVNEIEVAGGGRPYTIQ